MLGRGGYGAVFLAEQMSVGRTCAVKVLVPGVSANASNQKRFEVEARATSGLNHPNTVVIYDFGVDDERGVLFIAMEHIDGESLRDVLQREGTLDVRRAVRITHQIARSLHDAHGQGLVHRDVKPHNVMLTRRGGEADFVKVIDFGIAKVIDRGDIRKSMMSITKTGMVVGTPAYMSPEQVRNDPLDSQTDQYSLAVCVYQMLTGRTVFDATSPLDIATKHITQRPLPVSSLNRALDLSPAFDDVLLRALSKEPADRFSTTRDFGDALALAANVPLQLVATGEEPRDRPIDQPAGEEPVTAPLGAVDPHRATEGTPPVVKPAPKDRDRSDAAYAATASAERPPTPSRDEVAGHTLQVDSTDGATDEDDAPAWVFGASDLRSRREEAEMSAEAAGPAVRRVALIAVLGLAVVLVTAALGAWVGTRGADGPQERRQTIAEVAKSRASRMTEKIGAPESVVDIEPVATSSDAGPAVVEETGETAGRMPERRPELSAAAPEQPPAEVRVEAAIRTDREQMPEPDPPETTADPAPGRVTVTLLPWGELWVDGRDLGTRERRTITLRAGEHRFELRQNGEVRARKMVDVPAGENTMIELIAR